jgi:hypothetical protein
VIQGGRIHAEDFGLPCLSNRTLEQNAGINQPLPGLWTPIRGDESSRDLLASHRGRLGHGRFIRHHYDFRSQGLGRWEKVGHVGSRRGEGEGRSTGNKGIANGPRAEIKGKLSASGFFPTAGGNPGKAAIEAGEAWVGSKG